MLSFVRASSNLLFLATWLVGRKKKKKVKSDDKISVKGKKIVELLCPANF